jgi:hypothetical protein
MIGTPAFTVGGETARLNEEAELKRRLKGRSTLPRDEFLEYVQEVFGPDPTKEITEADRRSVDAILPWLEPAAKSKYGRIYLRPKMLDPGP